MKPRSPVHRHADRQGIVLFEMLIALFVFVIVSFALLKLLNAALDMAQERTTIDKVTLGLQNQLALLHSDRLVTGGHELPDDGSGLSYYLTVAPEQLQDQTRQPLAGIYRATLTVKWKSDGRTQSRVVSELIFQP